MRRLSKPYLTAKAVHLWLRAFVHPPAMLFSNPGYLHALEGRLLYWLAAQAPPGGLVLEIGSFMGKSSCFLAAGLSPGARLACVDTWQNRGMPYDPPSDSLPKFLTNTSAYRDAIEVHRGMSAQIAANWSRAVDVLFIDGDHSYEGCCTDLNSWMKFVRPGGWIAFHDSSTEGVARVIEEFFPPSARYSDRWAWSTFAARTRNSRVVQFPSASLCELPGPVRREANQ